MVGVDLYNVPALLPSVARQTSIWSSIEASDPGLRDGAFEILRGPIERVVVHPGEDGPQIELVGEVVGMVELGLDGKQAALPGEAACSVKVVAGARNHLCRTRIKWSQPYRRGLRAVERTRHS